jgi:hypothetical protein
MLFIILCAFWGLAGIFALIYDFVIIKFLKEEFKEWKKWRTKGK